MPQGRNEEIRKGGIGIEKKKKKEKEEVKEEEEEERTEDNRGIVYVDIRCKVQERWKERKGRRESSRTKKRERGEFVRGRGRKPRNNWRSGGGRISCCLASAPFKESLAFC